MLRSVRYRVLVAIWFTVTLAATAQELFLTSPDGSHEVRFFQTMVADGVRKVLIK